MNDQPTELNWQREQIWKGCMFAAIAHAIMVAHFPEFSHEHSWDGINYNVQDTEGIRGTVTFGPDYIVAAFRDEHSDRLAGNEVRAAADYFRGAPDEVLELANSETLQYLLDEVDGQVKPLITGSFWTTANRTYTLNRQEELYKGGLSILEYQLMEPDEALEAWKENYGMTDEQCELLLSVYNRKITSPEEKIVLTKDEVKQIGEADEEGLNESKISFEEIGIEWE